MSTNQVTLWSFLTQSNAKREILCPDHLRVSIEEFAAELKTQLKANQLPAEAELTQVNWDDTHMTQPLILIRYTGNQASTNVLQYAVGLEQLGNFAYLEKRIYLIPPQLPQKLQAKIPGKFTNLQERKKIDGCGCTGIVFLLGIVCLGFAVSILLDAMSWGWSYTPMQPILFFLPGALAFFFWGMKRVNYIRAENSKIDSQNSTISHKNSVTKRQNAEIEEWNRKKEQVDNLWDQTFDRWYEETLEVAYLSQTVDVFGRWTSAISTTIDQVVQKLFTDRHAQAQQWYEERKSQEQLEQEMERRRAEAYN